VLNVTERPLRLLRFDGGTRSDSRVDRWFAEQEPVLGALAKPCFEHMLGQGDDVRMLLHDGHPTACIGDAAFGYVNAFSKHVNVGFFIGAWLDDPSGLLEGLGKRMRHVKLQPSDGSIPDAVFDLIDQSYQRVAALIRDGAL
jgi:hypothetical protein